MSKTLQISELTLRYSSQGSVAVEDISLELIAGEILAIIGPSGSGKSSFLRLLAGLEEPSSGCIHLDGKCLSSSKACLPAEKRSIGLVSQSGDLFPHMTVEKNIGYGIHKWKRSARKERIKEMLAAIEMPEFAKRYPAELSGGEAQRVALARALAPKPKVLLLDEPFSSLDSGLRERLREMTTRLIRENGATSIFVTHHACDALASADRIAFFKGGKLDRVGASDCRTTIANCQDDLDTPSN